MTVRERAHKLIDELPDDRVEDALVALEALEERERSGAESGRIVDEWGDLSAQTDAAAVDTMRRLDEKERAEFGETLAEAWGRERSK